MKIMASLYCLPTNIIFKRDFVKFLLFIFTDSFIQQCEMCLRLQRQEQLEDKIADKRVCCISMQHGLRKDPSYEQHEQQDVRLIMYIIIQVFNEQHQHLHSTFLHQIFGQHFHHKNSFLSAKHLSIFQLHHNIRTFHNSFVMSEQHFFNWILQNRTNNFSSAALQLEEIIKKAKSSLFLA